MLCSNIFSAYVNESEQEASFRKILLKGGEKVIISRCGIYSGPPIFDFILGYPDEEHRG